MSTSAITVSYHLPALIRTHIDTQAKKHKCSKGMFLAYLIEDYQKIKTENANLKSYFSIATDKKFLQDQILESESDFLAELKSNPQFA